MESVKQRLKVRGVKLFPEFVFVYNGTAWSVLAESSGIYTLLVDSTDTLVAIGDFAMVINGERFACAACYDGIAWSKLGADCSNSPRWYNAAVAGDRLLVGSEEPYQAGSTAVWDGSVWKERLHVSDGSSAAVVYHRGSAFLSGPFTTFDGRPASRVGAFNVTDLVSFPVPGLDEPALACVSDGDRLFAGGIFRTTADGTPVGPIAVLEEGAVAWQTAGAGIATTGTVVITLAHF